MEEETSAASAGAIEAKREAAEQAAADEEAAEERAELARMKKDEDEEAASEREYQIQLPGMIATTMEEAREKIKAQLLEVTKLKAGTVFSF
jgi:hypothetical protein